MIPKELLLLGDRPVLHHALDEAVLGGFSGAVLVTAPWKRPLFERYLAAAEVPLPVQVVEQPAPTGIGAAVLRAAPAAGSVFGVLLPDDVVVTADHWHRLRAHADTAVCVRPVPAGEVSRFGIVVLRNGKTVRVVEKPPVGSIDSNLGIFGRYLLDGEAVAALERIQATNLEGELQLTYGLAAVRDLRVVEFEGEVYDCGTPDSYLESTARWFARVSGASTAR